jgi:hypothetical protein
MKHAAHGLFVELQGTTLPETAAIVKANRGHGAEAEIRRIQRSRYSRNALLYISFNEKSNTISSVRYWHGVQGAVHSLCRFSRYCVTEREERFECWFKIVDIDDQLRHQRIQF